MPGRELRDPMQVTDFPKSASLKAHKLLPRRKVLPDDMWISSYNTVERKHIEQEDFCKIELSEHIRSWIPEPPLFQASPSYRLPLTPPALSKEDEDTSVMEVADSKIDGVPANIGTRSPGLSTPVNQRSPPTPDMTPPRKQTKSANLTPPPTCRLPSSRAESFETAREQFSSDDESPRHESPSIPSPRQNWLHTARPSKVRDIGLGLGLESDHDDDRTPTVQTPQPLPEGLEYVTFNGTWGGGRDDVNYQSPSNEPTRVTLRKKLRNLQQRNGAKDSRSSPPYADDHTSSLQRGFSLRERVEKSRHSPASASTERFAEQIDWPMKDDDLDIDARLRQVDNRRFSQMSATSTIVSAMVVETPPQRRRTLRHTNKNPALRATSSPVKESNRSSFVSNDIQHRLVHRNTRITDQLNRRSMASDTSTSLSSGFPRASTETSPAAMIPERGSSLRSSATGGRRHSRNLSHNSTRQQLPNTTTVPDRDIGYFDLQIRRLRPMPAAMPSSSPSTSERIKDKDSPPAIPVRSSSLSAPTSRNVSRTTSLTSTSLQAHNAQKQTEMTLAPSSLRMKEHKNAQTETLGSSNVGDFSALGPQSALVTPFSMTSIHSSTPGTLEVNEATAVNIYPHNNKSILVVQQMARSESQQPEQDAVLIEKADVIFSEPATPTNVHRPKQLVDSPLRNPRQPPTPPAFTIIPPTPAILTPVLEKDAKLERPSSMSTNNGPFAMVRRALSARRYSESFVSPLTRSLSRRNTTTNRRPSVADQSDSKLHPFWRPRGFWEDLSDSESDFGTDGFLVSNTLGTPQKGVVSGPPTLSRRLGSFKFRRRSSHYRGIAIRRKRSSESMHSYEFIQPERKHLNIMPRLGYQVQFVGFAGLQDKFERRKARKEEGRRERERERLRSSIGAVIAQPDARVV
ncbi:hypothetical protein MMC24_006787 [Lignoscripta atroalba]|nr:hypothetical protein [Lignoscripta atroalba]